MVLEALELDLTIRPRSPRFIESFLKLLEFFLPSWDRTDPVPIRSCVFVPNLPIEVMEVLEGLLPQKVAKLCFVLGDAEAKVIRKLALRDFEMDVVADKGKMDSRISCL